MTAFVHLLESLPSCANGIIIDVIENILTSHFKSDANLHSMGHLQFIFVLFCVLFLKNLFIFNVLESK